MDKKKTRFIILIHHDVESFDDDYTHYVEKEMYPEKSFYNLVTRICFRSFK